MAGHVDRDPGGQPARCRSSDGNRTAVGGEGSRPGRVELHERGMAVARDVCRVVRREVGARQRTWHRGGRAAHRLRDCAILGRVADGVEDDDARRTHSRAERPQCALASLVGGLAGNREALVPARRHLPGGEAADDDQDEPAANHRPAVSDGHVRNAGTDRSARRRWRRAAPARRKAREREPGAGHRGHRRAQHREAWRTKIIYGGRASSPRYSRNRVRVITASLWSRTTLAGWLLRSQRLTAPEILDRG